MTRLLSTNSYFFNQLFDLSYIRLWSHRSAIVHLFLLPKTLALGFHKGKGRTYTPLLFLLPSFRNANGKEPSTQPGVNPGIAQILSKNAASAQNVLPMALLTSHHNIELHISESTAPYIHFVSNHHTTNTRLAQPSKRHNGLQRTTLARHRPPLRPFPPNPLPHHRREQMAAQTRRIHECSRLRPRPH
jgi:hypothetical protein